LGGRDDARNSQCQKAGPSRWSRSTPSTRRG
jgi:hypothetical protein